MKSRKTKINKVNFWMIFFIPSFFSLTICNVVQAASPVAIPMEYHVVENRSKYITLAAWSEDITYNTHTYLDYPDINWSTRYKAYRVGDGGVAINTWTMVSAPTHGTLYENQTALSSNDNISDPDDLLYVPEQDYVGTDSFTFQVEDSIGASNLAIVKLDVEAPDAYMIPTGIPDPGFGIADEPPADPSEWPNAEVAGYYYLDNSGTCSDTNTYGYPNNPRCTIPSSPVVPAGKKMVIKASPSPYFTRSSVAWQQFRLDGAAGNRAWLIGVNDGPNKPIIKNNIAQPNTNIRMEGSYWTIDGLIFDDAIPSVRADLGTESYVVIRHSEIRNKSGTVGSATSMNVSTQNGLYFDNRIHDNGRIEEDLSAEHDMHGIQVSSPTNLWILDNIFHENAGDAVQINGDCHNIYIGRNKMHSEGENAVDTKSFDTLIVSENDGWDMRLVTYGNSGGNAQVFYINDEGTQIGGWWAINNRAWDSGGPGISSAALTTDVHIVGNLIKWCGDGIQNFTHGGYTAFIYNNTIDQCRRSALNVSVAGGPEAFTRFSGNYIGSGTWINQVKAIGGLTTDTGSFQELDWNYFEEPVNLLWANTSRDLQWMRDNTGWLDNVVENVVPAFINSADFDYTPSISSPLKDQHANIFTSYTAFNSSFLRSIQYDRGGISRPQGNAWDVGAYEYVVHIRGDVDSSGTTNTTDALLTLRNSLGLSMTSTAWQTSATTGDVDCNGISNSTDALLILRFSLGLSMGSTAWCEGS